MIKYYFDLGIIEWVTKNIFITRKYTKKSY